MALILAILAALVFVGAPARADVGYSIPDSRDVPKSAWYYDYVMTLAEEEIVKGYGTSGEIRPFNQVIREHAAKMIVLAAESSPECWCKFTFRYLYPSSNLPVFRIGLRAGQF